jgi:hypothetical protein
VIEAQTPQPAQPAAPAVPGGPVIVQVTPGGEAAIRGTPTAVFQAYQNQREELGNQLDRLEGQRRDISRRLQENEGPLNDVDKKGLEARLAQVDARIAVTEKAIEVADANVAKAAAVPGAVVHPAPERPSGPPEEFIILPLVFTFVVLLPLSIAYARRIWRRSATAITSLPQEIYDRFARVDQSLDAIAIEVERIGEGQRFLTRLHTEQQKALGAGAAERIDVGDRERERQRRIP